MSWAGLCQSCCGGAWGCGRALWTGGSRRGRGASSAHTRPARAHLTTNSHELTPLTCLGFPASKDAGPTVRAGHLFCRIEYKIPIFKHFT